MRFLVEEFIQVPELDPEAEKASDPFEGAPTGLEQMQAAAARILLPGPKRGAFTLQQSALLGLPLSEFQQLRREVREWLRTVVMHPGTGHRRTLQGPIDVWLYTKRGDLARTPLIEGNGRDVFWYYLTHLVARAGIDRIGVCHAPRSRKDPGQEEWFRLAGMTEPCLTLFLRRGTAKQFCSDRCRARVATQRVRPSPMEARRGKKK